MILRPRNSIAFICIVFSLCSCDRSRTLTSVSFEATPVISEYDRYALILDPYISLRDVPGDSGITIAHARRGDVHEVKGVRLLLKSGKPESWLKLGEGWIHAESVHLYSSREKALRVAETFED